eukprot:3195407-Rhodomonas_salina.1
MDCASCAVAGNSCRSHTALSESVMTHPRATHSPGSGVSSCRCSIRASQAEHRQAWTVAASLASHMRTEHRISSASVRTEHGSGGRRAGYLERCGVLRGKRCDRRLPRLHPPHNTHLSARITSSFLSLPPPQKTKKKH